MKEKKRSLKYCPSVLRGLPEPTITAALMQWFLRGPGIAFSIPHYTENKYAKQEHFFHPCAFLLFLCVLGQQSWQEQSELRKS